MTLDIFHDQSPRKIVANQAEVEPATSWSLVGRASNWATEAGTMRQMDEFMPSGFS